MGGPKLSPSLTLGTSVSTPASPSFFDALLRAHCCHVYFSDSPLYMTPTVSLVKGQRHLLRRLSLSQPFTFLCRLSVRVYLWC